MSKKSTFKKRWQRVARIGDSVLLKIIVVVIVIGLFVGYIGKVNVTSTKGYAIRDLELQVKNLEHETQQLDIELAQNSSMQTLKQRVDHMGMEQAENVEYLMPLGTAVARR